MCNTIIFPSTINHINHKEDNKMLRIYYAINPRFKDETVDPLTISTTHKFVGSFPSDNLDEAFRFFQGEIWSPEGEARNLIKGLGLHHTSMSVGDLAINDDDVIFQCLGTGWREISPMSTSDYDATDIDRLRSVYSAVADKEDWKAPIDVVIPTKDLPITLEAIEFFTATKPEVIRSKNPGVVRVKSEGYRVGPAGDH